MTATIFLQFCGGCYVPVITGSRGFFIYSTKLADVHRINSGYLINPQPCKCTSHNFFLSPVLLSEDVSLNIFLVEYVTNVTKKHPSRSTRDQG